MPNSLRSRYHEPVSSWCASGLFWSVPFVAFGLGRYMVLVQSGRGGENPARILLGGDGWFLANVLAWAVVTGYAIFVH